MDLIPVKPEEMSSLLHARRGKVSPDILTQFLESKLPVAKLAKEELQRSLPSLYASLRSYIKNQQLPVKAVLYRKELYLIRLDVDADGNFAPEEKLPE